MPQDYTPTTGLASGKKVKIPADADIADVVKAFKDYTDSLPAPAAGGGGGGLRFPMGRSDVTITEKTAEFAARFNRIPSKWNPESGSGGATDALAGDDSGAGNIYDINTVGTWLYVSSDSREKAATTGGLGATPDSMHTLMKTKTATTQSDGTAFEIGPSPALEGTLTLGDWYVIQNDTTNTQVWGTGMLWAATAADYLISAGPAIVYPDEQVLYVVTTERSGEGNGDGELAGIPLSVKSRPATSPAPPAPPAPSITPSAAAPTNPMEGEAWFEPTTGKLHIYYNGAWAEVHATPGS